MKKVSIFGATGSIGTNACKIISNNSSKYKVEVLSANKECESATLEISSQGLAKIVFKIDDFTSTYWLVGTKEID